ncbi:MULTISPECIES: conjugal transfer protein MobC [Hymenobacter]|uniref:TraM recognition site of TraD and TraG n=1 Tax=Hymenobacter mucosus TaxID=1411120 RepID=A0A239AWF5_9BACT|nr:MULTISPECIES: conjugal transfer protein MobC [Hymenobacter]MDF7815507.1 conjugal transfer protein MobC [Hymenobacter sp. YC55]SNR99937.1 TraM recognition site of TraD and TraG [Hymenobacter mucosus]
MEDEKALKKIMEFMRLFAIVLIGINIYYYCYGYFSLMGWSAAVVERIMGQLTKNSFLFKASWVSKTLAVVFLLLSCLGTKGRKDENVKGISVAGYGIIGLTLIYGSDLIRSIAMSPLVATALYSLLLAVGFLLLLSAGNWLSRLFNNDLMKDIFNKENESFPQEERLMQNEFSVNLRTEYQLRGKKRQGWLNVVNPFRATMVLGTPGSGKSFAVINEFIRQHLAKGFCMYIYDYKFDDLSRICYNTLLKHQDKFDKPVGFYVINFDNPRKSHRCNPLLPEMMTDIVDAYESASTIMLNLNKSWISKQGDFFVESPINFVAAIIWFLKLFEKGKYCTFPHVIEFLSRDYEEIFPVLASYPEIENLVKPFVSAFQKDAIEQLEGQIASARIPLGRLASPQLYWVMSGNDFTLDINSNEEPKVLCVGNNPDRQAIYGAALGLYNARLVKLVNKKGKRKSSIIIDELPTIYFKGLDNLIATARSNKVSTCLGFQDFSQLERDYGQKEAEVIKNTVGNVFSGQVSGNSGKWLSERFGKILQKRQSLSINMRETSTSLSTQMDSMIPASTIANLTQGNFVGAVADNFGEEIEQKVFHAKIQVDIKTVTAEAKNYQPIPDITSFINPATGKDEADEMIQANFRQIKTDVKDLCARELTRIKSDPDLKHLIKEKAEK